MTPSTRALWQAMTDLNPVRVGLALRDGADVMERNEVGQTPLEYLVLTSSTPGGDKSDAEHQRNQRSIERKLLNAGAAVIGAPDADGHTLVFHALLTHALAFHDEADVTLTVDVLNHMKAWIDRTRTDAPDDAWQNEAAQAWNAFLDLYGQDTEGNACPVPMTLGEPMLELLLTAGVTARALVAVDTPRFDMSVHFPTLTAHALAEERNTQAHALTAPTLSRRQPRRRT